MYHTGSDVLGVLIARVAGQPFEIFLKERIFDPLGMRDTGFFVPPRSSAGSRAAMRPTQPTARWNSSMTARTANGVGRRRLPAGGGGLVSTIDDYCAFGRMMLNKGKLGSERILARATVELMLTDQITPAQKADSPFSPGFWDYRGWGLGLSVITGRASTAMAPGQFGWSGVYGTRLGIGQRRGPRHPPDDPALQHGPDPRQRGLPHPRLSEPRRLTVGQGEVDRVQQQQPQRPISPRPATARSDRTRVARCEYSYY